MSSTDQAYLTIHQIGAILPVIRGALTNTALLYYVIIPTMARENISTVDGQADSDACVVRLDLVLHRASHTGTLHADSVTLSSSEVTVS